MSGNPATDEEKVANLAREKENEARRERLSTARNDVPAIMQDLNMEIAEYKRLQKETKRETDAKLQAEKAARETAETALLNLQNNPPAPAESGAFRAELDKANHDLQVAATANANIQQELQTAKDTIDTLTHQRDTVQQELQTAKWSVDTLTQQRDAAEQQLHAGQQAPNAHNDGQYQADLLERTAERDNARKEATDALAQRDIANSQFEELRNRCTITKKALASLYSALEAHNIPGLQYRRRNKEKTFMIDDLTNPANPGQLSQDIVSDIVNSLTADTEEQRRLKAIIEGLRAQIAAGDSSGEVTRITTENLLLQAQLAGSVGADPDCETQQQALQAEIEHLRQTIGERDQTIQQLRDQLAARDSSGEINRLRIDLARLSGAANGDASARERARLVGQNQARKLIIVALNDSINRHLNEIDLMDGTRPSGRTTRQVQQHLADLQTLMEANYRKWRIEDGAPATQGSLQDIITRLESGGANSLPATGIEGFPPSTDCAQLQLQLDQQRNELGALQGLNRNAIRQLLTRQNNNNADDNLQSQIDTIIDDLTAANNTIADQNGELRNLRNSAQPVDSQLTRLQNELNDANGNVAHLTSELADQSRLWQEEQDRAEDTANVLNVDLKREKRENAALRAQLAAANDQIANSQQAPAAQDNGATLAPANATIANLQRELRDANIRITSLEDELNAAKNTITGVQNSLRTGNTRIHELEAELATTDHDLTERDDELTDARNVNEALRAELATANGTDQTLQADLLAANNTIDRLRNADPNAQSNADLLDRIADIENQWNDSQEAAENEANTLTTEIKRLKRERAGLRAELAAARNEVVTANGANQAIQADLTTANANVNRLRAAIERLISGGQDALAGRAPAPGAAQDDASRRQMEELQTLLRDCEEARQNPAQGAPQDAATLKRGIDALQTQLQNCQQARDAAQQELRAAEAASAASGRDNANLRKQIRAIEGQLRDCQAARQTLEGQLRDCNTTLHSAQHGDEAALQEKIKDLEKKLEDCNKAIQSTSLGDNAALQVLGNADNAAPQKTIRDLEAEIQRLKAAAVREAAINTELAEAASQDHHVELTDLEEQVRERDETIKGLTAEHDQLEQQIAQLQTELQNAAAQAGKGGAATENATEIIRLNAKVRQIKEDNLAVLQVVRDQNLRLLKDKKDLEAQLKNASGSGDQAVNAAEIVRLRDEVQRLTATEAELDHNITELEDVITGHENTIRGHDEAVRVLEEQIDVLNATAASNPASSATTLKAVTEAYKNLNKKYQTRMKTIPPP